MDSTHRSTQDGTTACVPDIVNLEANRDSFELISVSQLDMD